MRTVARMSLRSIGQEAIMHKRGRVAIPLLLFFASFAGEADAAKPNPEATAKLLEDSGQDIHVDKLKMGRYLCGGMGPAPLVELTGALGAA